MITEDGMKTICEFVGVTYQKGYTYRENAINITVPQTKLDYNLLMKAVEKIKDKAEITFNNKKYITAQLDRLGEFKVFQFHRYPTTEEALATAVLWVLKEIGQ
jgi:hypothetical protein